MDNTVLVAGGGIAGLTFALTCHQIGVPVTVFESAAELRPLGVGINLQPNAVRELIELGLGDDLTTIGVATEEYGFYTKFGEEIWIEPRGTLAGYAWPQYSVHRGELQMLLYRAACERLGAGRVLTAHRVTGFENHADRVELRFDGADPVTGALLVGADGLHSAVRAQMVPGEGAPSWGGAILWRGATRAEPFRGGASMALVGHETQRFVTYPISSTDPTTGQALINWLAELTINRAGPPEPALYEFASGERRPPPGGALKIGGVRRGWNREDWSRRGNVDDFLHEFVDWRFDWLDVPALVTATDAIFEYPMVDRDPLDRWRHGRATLMGDAAHVMYPVGSNGASQSIVDGRMLGRAILDHGVTVEALDAYEAVVRPATSAMVLANRGTGPDWVMNEVERRSGGVFDHIDDVMPYDERAAHAAKYKGIAGFSIDELNATPPIIPTG